MKGSPETYEKINFTNKPFRCLGLYLSTDLNEGISKTWEEQLKNVPTSWKQRKLTIQGKTAVLNHLAMPKLIYNLTLLPTSTKMLKLIEKEIYNFLWGNRFPIKKE